MADRENRDSNTRAKEERKLEWKNPRMLDLPEPPPGMKYRWVRESARGQDDSINVVRRMREGYEPLRPEELPDFIVPGVEYGALKGTVKVGDLVAMKIPTKIAKQRKAHYDAFADKMQAEVDRELMKHDSDDMPIIRERKSRVTYGRKAKFAPDDEEDN